MGDCHQRGLRHCDILGREGGRGEEGEREVHVVMYIVHVEEVSIGTRGSDIFATAEVR